MKDAASFCYRMLHNALITPKGRDELLFESKPISCFSMKSEIGLLDMVVENIKVTTYF